MLLCLDESLFSCAGGSCAFAVSDAVDADRGLGGRLVTRDPPLGGTGNVPMLVVFRIVFGRVVFIEGTSGGWLLRVGTAGVELVLNGRGVGRPEGVTERLGIALFLGVVVGSCEGVDLRRDSPPMSLGLSGDKRRVFVTGSAGRGPFGGGGRAVRGSVEVEVMVEVISQCGGGLLRLSARRRLLAPLEGSRPTAKVLLS